MITVYATIESLTTHTALVSMEASNGHFAFGKIELKNPIPGDLYELGYTTAARWAKSNGYRLDRYTRA